MKRSRPDYASMSDPAQNPQWRRRWFERPEKALPPKRPHRIVSWRLDRDGPLPADRKRQKKEQRRAK
jgi:hypothetical protein